jgi:hypothetical protein
MSSSCRKWHQGTLHYLLREYPVCLVVESRQGLWSNGAHEFPLHWSLCSSAHTTSLQWGPVAVCNEQDFHVLLSLKYVQILSASRSRQVWDAAGPLFVYSLYSTGARTEPSGTPASNFLGVENSPSNKTSNFMPVIKEATSLIRLV